MGASKGMTRRQFLITAGAISAASAASVSVRAGANDRIRLGLIGCGGMGMRHLQDLVKRDDVSVVAVCDVFDPHMERAREMAGGKCEGFRDYRDVLDRNDVDAVFIASPDHWHALQTIHACQAGKDVYVEKPASTTIRESRAMVDAARRHDRVVQVGTQQRSLAMFREAVELVRNGALGTVTMAGSWIGPNAIGPYEEHENPPEELDWDMWLGPAPYVPYSPQRQFGFRGFNDYANGELTNWGAHLLDVNQWAIGEDYPISVQALGGSHRALGGFDDPETAHLLYEFTHCTVFWDQNHHNSRKGKNYGMFFKGTEGALYMDRASFIVEPEDLGVEERFEEGDTWVQVETHHEDFLDAIRSRRRPLSDIEESHKTNTTCLLGAIALQTRRKMIWDGERERFVNDEKANRHLHRPYREPWRLEGEGRIRYEYTE